MNHTHFWTIVFSRMNLLTRIFAFFSKSSYIYEANVSRESRRPGMDRCTWRSSGENCSVSSSIDFGGRVSSGLPSSLESFVRRSKMGFRMP